MDDPKHEPAEHAALRRVSERLLKMSEELRLLGPRREPEERELLRKFDWGLLREKTKQKFKQVAAVAAYAVPLCFLWWRLGMLPGILAALALAPVLLILAFNGLIVWMIWRKVKNPDWTIGWGAIFLCILFNTVIMLLPPSKCLVTNDCPFTP